jgi:4-hydroxy-3-polyprenylbenzoate decarboxylase
MKIAVAITGASGVIYGLRLLNVLKEDGAQTTCMVSDAAKKIIGLENTGKDKGLEGCLPEDNIEAGIASGSFKMDAMVIIPCSMKTLSAVSNGYASNLITRAADVMLKEGRKLVIVPRETPLSSIHLENMLKLSRMGAVILPAMPAFYHSPEDIEDLVDFVVGKVLDVLDIDHKLYRRWGSGS